MLFLLFTKSIDYFRKNKNIEKIKFIIFQYKLTINKIKIQLIYKYV